MIVVLTNEEKKNNFPKEVHLHDSRAHGVLTTLRPFHICQIVLRISSCVPQPHTYPTLHPNASRPQCPSLEPSPSTHGRLNNATSESASEFLHDASLLLKISHLNFLKILPELFIFITLKSLISS